MEHLKRFIAFMKTNNPHSRIIPGDYRVYEDEEIRAQIDATQSSTQTLFIYTKGPLGEKLVFSSSRQGVHHYDKGIWEERIKEIINLSSTPGVVNNPVMNTLERTKAVLGQSSLPRPTITTLPEPPKIDIPVPLDIAFPEAPITETGEVFAEKNIDNKD